MEYRVHKSDEPQYADVPWVHRIFTLQHQCVTLRSSFSTLPPEVMQELKVRAVDQAKTIYREFLRDLKALPDNG